MPPSAPKPIVPRIRPTQSRACSYRPLVPPRKERPLLFALPPVASAKDTAKAISGVLAALAQGLVTLGEASEAKLTTSWRGLPWS